jgi:hypothetical protein
MALTVDDRRAVLAGWLQLARSQVLENGNIKNNIY